jgi:glycerate 2-kinase
MKCDLYVCAAWQGGVMSPQIFFNIIMFAQKQSPDLRMGRYFPREWLLDLFQTAVARAQPDVCLPAMLPAPPAAGRLIVIACGKAGASMARVAEQHYGDMIAQGRYDALAVTRHGYGLSLAITRQIEAGHPVPDDASVHAAQAALAMVRSAGPDDRVLMLLSGGASALCAAPVDGVSLADKQDLTRALLRCGATIHDINCVRKHLSRFKGGGLARAAHPAALVTLAISDVPGDQPQSIGSGPSVPDPSTLAEARAVLERFAVTPPPAIMAALNDPANETAKAGDPIFERSTYHLAASARDALEAAAGRAAQLGYEPVILGDALEGEARDVAAQHAAIALEHRQGGRKVALLSGGELTVTIRGPGRGGPNQEFALALCLALDGADGIHALAGDTDGSDGGTGADDDPAGALVGPDTLARAQALNLEAATFLANNDSTGFFARLDDLVQCGPTRTNVNDFRVILVDDPASSAGRSL